MPFDLYVSRAGTYGAMRGDQSAGPRQGFFARVFSKSSAAPASPPAPITSDEFHAVMRGAPSSAKGDHLYWVHYPDGDPWFVAEWKADGRVLLSTSYSNHRYLRNFADMFDQGLRISGELNARLFEEVGEREITKSNIDSVLAPDGKYVALQVSTWRHAIAQLSEQATAPLEFPLGPIDIVSEYLLFHVVPERPIADDSVPALLAHAQEGVNVQVAQEGAWYAVDADGDKGLAKVLRRPDGKWQVWPAWGQASFPRVAATTVALAENLHRAAGGEIQFLGRPFGESLRKEIRARVGGLGVDFYEWTQQLAT